MQNTEKQTNEDLEYSGRKANVNLNFRLFGKSKHQQYYTPIELSKTIFEMLLPMIKQDIKDISILDPTCGSGRLLVPWKKANASVLGIELDKESAKVAKRLIGKENVRVGDILDYEKHLEDFSLVLTNPPYGIYWNIKDRDFSFDSECYGGSVESQAATIEISTDALAYGGVLVAIIPTTTFSNAKDKKIRTHLYDRYNILLKATLKNLFKKEYNINVSVDLVIAQKRYYEEDRLCQKLELDTLKDNWQATLIALMHRIIKEKEIEMRISRVNYVPFLDSIKAIPITNSLTITPKGIAGQVSSVSVLDFINQVMNDYNPIQGVETGIIEAYLSPPTLIKRGIEPAKQMLSRLGFEPSIRETDIKKIEKLKARYDFLATPIYRPKSHQLLAYFYDKEYEAKETVKNSDKIIFEKGKKYHLHPSWIRRKEVIDIAKAYDERKKKEVTIKTELDRGYLSIKALTEQGERSFNEIDLEEIKLFTKAFSLPIIKDLNDKYPELVGKYRERIEKEMPFLFEYQKEDLSRLALKNFGYIGYEMGGGKTVASACWAKLRNYKRVLVVCQSALINNWLNELKKFGFKAKRLTTHASINKLQTMKREKREDETTFYIISYEFLSLDTRRKYDPWDCIEYDKDGNIRRSATGITSEKCPLCHKTFSNVVKQCPKCQKSESWTGNVCESCGYIAYTYYEGKTYPAYKRIKKLFNAVIVDEAQLAKTKNSGRGRAVRALKPKGKLILTGTLMKGYITDIFWNVGWLLGYGNPLFHYNYIGGSKRFLEEFGTFKYVTKQFEDTLSEGKARLIPEVSNLNRFWRIMASFTIRRLKNEMIKLPKKHKHIQLLQMDKEHAELYNEFQEWATKTINRALQIAQNEQEVNMGVISSALWKLRFAASVPTASDYLCNEPGPKIALPQYYRWNKLLKITELVREIKSRNEKVIIFSGLRPMVSSIIKALRRERISFLPILASHKTSRRFEMVERFNQDKYITAIVAGLNVLNHGFTITSANNVILTDIEYSPESALQAEDRAHRTGQQKEVNIYYLFSQDTIDEIMFDLVSKKQAAIANAIDGKASHSDVAEFLESMGNIQLEVAKKVITKPLAYVEKKIELPPVQTITTEYKERTNLYEELYKIKVEIESRKKKKKIEQPTNQLALTF